MAPRAERPAAARRAARAALVVVYVGFVAAGFLVPWQPRAFWTVALPLLVLFVVLGGFHLWRELCPLAFFGELGRRLNRGRQRKVPERLEAVHLLVPFLLLASMLVLRLVATNGDGRWLAALLVALAVAAAVTNATFTGKSWCNFVCPVGFVERVYTDPGSLRRAPNSQCARCTACKRSCPDIDQENQYWRELDGGGRRLATFAFPGLVLAFYGYFWLRTGDWEAYFDGRWTRQPATAELAFGPGLFFAPGVPALVAATATVALLSAASWGLFAGVESALGRQVADAERRRHLALSLAAFSAFSLFYLFAGAPTLRRIPYGTRALAFLAPALATLVLARRWRRSRESYVREKGAAKLLRNWPFEEAPPDDPAEAYALVQATERAREKVLAGYTQTVRELLGDGILRGGERRLFEELRKQFGITPREHDKIVAELDEEQRERLAAGAPAAVESRLQLESYQVALADALLRRASAAEVEELRRAFGVDPDAHAALAERLRGGGGEMAARAQRRIEEAAAAAAERAAVAAGPASPARELLGALLERVEARAIERALDALETLGDADLVRLVRPALLGADGAGRRAGLRQLAEACPESGAEVRALERLLAGPPAPAAEGTGAAAPARLLDSPDRYVRAAALWAAAGEAAATERAALLRRGTEDAAEVVRTTAAILGAREGEPRGYLDLGPIERMQFLRRVPLLAGLEAEDLEELAAFAREETVPAGTPICVEGVPDAGDLFVLLAGEAAVTVRAGGEESAGEREVAALGANEIVGELALVDGSPRSATVRARGGPLRLLRIPGPAFRARLLRRESVAAALLATLTDRLRRLSGRLAAER